MLDVTIHGEAESSFIIVPVKINTGKFGAFPIFVDGGMWLESFVLVVGMALSDVLYTNIVNDEDEEDRAPFVAPKDRGGGGLLVPLCVEAILEELVGKHTGLV